jgi:gliding motility-associated protein GldE
MAVPLQVLSVIFKWPANVLIKSSNFIEKRLRKQDGRISLGELEHALEITTTEETSDEQEQRILEGIVKFGNTDAKQIMTPRMDVTAFHIELNFRQVLDGITESGFSRIPVYQDSFDQIKGVLYAKDFIRHLDEADDFNWQPLIRQAFFVPENRKIDDLLRDFQNRKMHMAIVVDEYGGSSGIVTLEDVLEEIIGDITDEFDEDEIRHKRIDDHNVIFDGKTSLIDVYRILDIDGDEFEANKGESDTLAGFLLELSGRIMHKNERISFGDYIFTVEGADRRRVKQIKVTIKETADSTAKND